MTRHQKRMLKQAVQQVGLHILFIVICFVTLIPILYALSVSLNADNSLVSSDFRFIPKNFTLRNYVAVFTEEPVMLWFKNSMTLAVVTVLISLTASIPAAYAFSRMHFKGRKPILKQLVLLYSFPSVLSMFAIYTLLRPLGLINSKVGLILIYTGTMAEFALLNMKGYFDTINTDSIPIHSPNPLPLDEDETVASPPERTGSRKEAAYQIYRDLILENIEYDTLTQNPRIDREQLDEIMDILLETVCTNRKSIRVAGDDYPAELVKAKFLKLDSHHIEFVMDCLRDNTTKVRNIKQYLRAMLFNAPSTINSYYASLVAHDMAQPDWGCPPNT